MKFFRLCGLAIASLSLAGCTAVGAFNALTPVDAGAKLVGADIPYGSLPRQRLDVYAPQDGGARRPVVVFFYGGGWESGRKEDYAFVGKALAARGFLAVIPDYRLVPEVRFPGFIEDGAGAVAWTHEHIGDFGGDARRLYLFGHSAGAYNAAMLTLDAGYLARAGLAPGALRATAALAGPYDFLPLDAPETIAAFGETRPLSQTQPINFARRSAPPMFLAAGAADETVYPRNTTESCQKNANGRRGRGGKDLSRRFPFRNSARSVAAISKQCASFGRRDPLL